MQMEKQYWPGQDYPDREKWLARRYTAPKLIHASVFFGSTRWGTFNPGVNKLKREAEAQRQLFIKSGHCLMFGEADDTLTFIHAKRLPIRVQLLDLRRKAQQQGHVTIEPDAKSQADRRQKRGLR